MSGSPLEVTENRAMLKLTPAVSAVCGTSKKSRAVNVRCSRNGLVYEVFDAKFTR